MGSDSERDQETGRIKMAGGERVAELKSKIPHAGTRCKSVRSNLRKKHGPCCTSDKIRQDETCGIERSRSGKSRWQMGKSVRLAGEYGRPRRFPERTFQRQERQGVLRDTEQGEHIRDRLAIADCQKAWDEGAAHEDDTWNAREG